MSAASGLVQTTSGQVRGTGAGRAAGVAGHPVRRAAVRPAAVPAAAAAAVLDRGPPGHRARPGRLAERSGQPVHGRARRAQPGRGLPVRQRDRARPAVARSGRVPGAGLGARRRLRAGLGRRATWSGTRPTWRAAASSSSRSTTGSARSASCTWGTPPGRTSPRPGSPASWIRSRRCGGCAPASRRSAGIRTGSARTVSRPGAKSIANLLASPLAAGLVSRAISASGGGEHVATAGQADAVRRLLLAALGLTDATAQPAAAGRRPRGDRGAGGHRGRPGRHVGVAAGARRARASRCCPSGPSPRAPPRASRC